MSGLYETIDDKKEDGYEIPTNNQENRYENTRNINTIYENECNDHPAASQGGQINAAFESQNEMVQIGTTDVRNSDLNTESDQNAERYEQLNFSATRTETKKNTHCCKIDRKIILIIMGVILLLIVVVVAVVVSMAMQSDGDIGWAKWSSWGSCSVVGCGTGTHERLRLCKESECPGPDRQTQNCTVNCPLDGAWTVWSNWGSSSITCGNGQMLRTRTCTDPAPQYGGQQCSGSGKQSQNCIVNCPIDGAWTDWSIWSSCSSRCTVGTTQRTRHRTCTDPAPEHGGQECSGPDTETENCTESHCSASVCFDSYTTFNESYRRESVRGCVGALSYACDDDKVTGDSWYRFKLPTGENGVLDTCPRPGTCGTCFPIWMNSSHPTEFGIISDVTMAASLGGARCSLWSGSGSVTKCSVDGEVFYLYKLWRPVTCSLSYCTGTYSFAED